jgi:hypothetical protein
VRDSKGQAYTVRYSAVNAMLLNEFRKQHSRVDAQARTIAEQQEEIMAQKARIALLEAAQEQVASLTARLGQVEALAARLDSSGKHPANP